jgi:ATP synthase protein I
MTGRQDPPSLKDLDARLRAARAKQDEARGGGKPGGQPPPKSGVGLGFRLAIDLVSGILVGVGIGLLLDHWLGTTPWLMVVFFFLGAAAGMLNVYRTASGKGFAVGYRKDGDRPEEPEDAERGDGA